MSSTSQDNSTPQGPATNNLTNYVELLSTCLPNRDTGMKHILRSTYPNLPMPLVLGLDFLNSENDYPEDLKIPNLLLTDIKSGATRAVVAPWMHALYQESKDRNGYCVSLVQLKEAQFGAAGGWPHLAAVCILLTQFFFGLYALVIRRVRDGCLLISGVILNLFDGLSSAKYPKYLPPRRVENARFYALHTGMATVHLLVLAHDPGTEDGPYRMVSSKRHINLEDAAVPWKRKASGGSRVREHILRRTLWLAQWGYRLAFALAPSDGFLIPTLLLLGTMGMEVIKSSTKALPKKSSYNIPTPEHRPSIINLLTVACKATGEISVGFIESILPDPTGKHEVYNWISGVMREGALTTGLPPAHESAGVVWSTAARLQTVKVLICCV
ncbi:hypothetical protein M422DRAFT_46496 [Sphaerobolus stellatus SS14]|uniref:Uncharacterized protein n=1 Tax=Sphaerobolus stellatus (strain SS14) TaxID=990650 RepID=A0A0C9USW4_SPHS4|nr:hypothetical protein M422DRAFT_46496 [Sphaerobolus stellatus SS14]